MVAQCDGDNRTFANVDSVPSKSYHSDFCKFRVWDEVPEGNIVTLGDNRIPCDSQRILLGQFEAKSLCPKHIVRSAIFATFAICVLVMVNTAH